MKEKIKFSVNITVIEITVRYGFLEACHNT